MKNKLVYLFGIVVCIAIIAIALNFDNIIYYLSNLFLSFVKSLF